MGASPVQDALPRSESLHSVLSYKRLDKRVFQLPEPTAPETRHVEVDDATLEALLDGIQVDAAPRARARRPRLH